MPPEQDPVHKISLKASAGSEKHTQQRDGNGQAAAHAARVGTCAHARRLGQLDAPQQRCRLRLHQPPRDALHAKCRA